MGRDVTLAIRIDPERCMGSGNCSFWAPATFELGEDGVAMVVNPQGDPEDKVIVAANRCSAAELGSPAPASITAS